MANSILNKVTEELSALELELTSFKNSVAYLNDAKRNVESAVNSVSDAEKYHLEKLSKINDAYEKYDALSNTVKELTAKIEGVDFPSRLTNIENSMSQLMKELNIITDTTLKEIKLASEVISKTDFENHFSSLHTGIQLLNSESSNNAKQIGLKIDKDKNELERRMSNSFTDLTSLLNSLVKAISTAQSTINETKMALESFRRTSTELLDKKAITEKEQFEKINSRIIKFQIIMISIILIAFSTIIYFLVKDHI